MDSFLGIQDNEKEAYRDILKSFAATDNWHDFHHTNSAEVLDRLGKSYNVNSGLSVRQYQSKVLALRSNFVGTTLYDMFKNEPSQIMLLGGTPEDLKQASEDNVLDALLPAGNKYINIKNALINTNPPAKFNLFQGNNISIGIKERPYTITAAPVKNQGNVLDIAPAFQSVSPNGSVVNYILMIDASFLSISRLRSLMNVQGVATYNFYIIQSIENDGDPATKISRFDDSNVKVNVYFLKDTGHTTYYLPYEGHQGDSSNLLSGCTISCSRSTDGTITADIKSDTVNTTIDNVGTASEPMEGGFLAFQNLLIKGTGNIDEAFVYYLMKRAGDWCQALCLLDRGRKYTVEAVGNSAPYVGTNPISLQQLIQNKAPVEVALLTHDKILLSYALLLGLNVFYTIKTVSAAPAADGASNTVIWLTYFKNTLDSDPAAVLKAANEKYENVKNDARAIVRVLDDTIDVNNINFETENFTPIDTIINTLYDSILETSITLIKENKEEKEDGNYTENTISKYILAVRVVLDYATKIAKKPEETIQSTLQTIRNTVKTTGNANNYFRIVSQAETILHTYLQLISSIQTLNSISDSIPESFAHEAQKIQELEDFLQKGVSFEHKSNESIPEPYQYFLETTAAAIQKDLHDFITKFSLNQASRNALYNALRFDTTKYTNIQAIRSARKKTDWQNNINAWYNAYIKKIDLPAQQNGGSYIQVGGNTLFDLNILIPLQQHYIRTRDYIIDDVNTMKKTLEHDLRNFFHINQQNNAFLNFLINTAENYYNIEKDSLKEPDLSLYINEVIHDFADRVIEHLDQQEQTVINNFNEAAIADDILQSLSQESINEFKSLYFTDTNETKYDTTLDVGTIVTYNDGYGYTALDNFIVTNDSKRIWRRWMNYQGALDSRVPYTIDFIFHRFLLFNLDILTNILHEIDGSYDDDNNFYYDDNAMRKMKQIKSVLDFIIAAFIEEKNRQAPITVVKQQIDELNTYIKTLQQQRNDLNQQSQTLQGDLNALNQQNNNILQEIDNLYADYNNITEELGNLYQQKQYYEEQWNQLNQNQYSKQNFNILQEQYQNQYYSITSQITNIEYDQQSMQMRGSQLQQQSQTIQGQIYQTQGLINQIPGEAQQIQNQIQGVQQQTQLLQGQLQGMFQVNKYNNNQRLMNGTQYFSGGFMDYTLFAPSVNNVTKSSLFSTLAEVKVDVIFSYYYSLQLKSTPKNLNDYQTVRLLYLLCPSDFNSIEDYFQSLKQKYPEKNSEIDITIVLTLLNMGLDVPADLQNENITNAVQEHLNRYGDDFYKYIKIRLGLQEGGKRKKRYRKTRSKKHSSRKRTTRRH